MGEVKKKCFVVTPIGDNNTAIRRHIEGIIDQAIIPAIGEKYEIDVAHRNYEIGSINDRVIKSIFNSDLVIANLTGLNPNVMFELAIRYSFGKPALVIAEEGTKLPFDINDENVIFYINDPAGAYELKEKIVGFEEKINLAKKDYGPVYKAVRTIPLFNEVEAGKEVSNDKLLEYVIERLDSIERQTVGNISMPKRDSYGVEFIIELDGIQGDITEEKKMQVIEKIGKYSEIWGCNWKEDGNMLINGMSDRSRAYINQLASRIKRDIRNMGIEFETTRTLIQNS